MVHSTTMNVHRCLGLVILLLCCVVSGQREQRLTQQIDPSVPPKNISAPWETPAHNINTTVAVSSTETVDSNSTALDTVPDDTQNGQSLLVSLATIAISEIGDKTFLIAAIMAMKHPRMTVFLGSFSSLSLMAILSAWLGHVVPNLIPKSYTDLLAAILFFCFGLRMLWEGWRLKPNSDNEEEDMMMDELEYELQEDLEDEEQHNNMDSSTLFEGNNHHRKMSHDMVMMDTLHYSDEVDDDDDTLLNNSDAGSSSSSTSPLTCEETSVNRRRPKKNIQDRLKQLMNLSSSPIFVQTFVLTFLGEWGDKSQISTIALAASNNVYWVASGVIVGHGLCTGLAVIGGRILANKISVRTVTLSGAILFLIFSIVYAHHFFQAQPE